jgi:outer membrane lipoprotein SlyB
MLCWSSLVTAQTVEELPGPPQPATSIEKLDLQGIFNEDITIADTTRTPDSTPVRRIERRRRDSVWNGVLIGAGAGALAGFALGKSLDSSACPRASECGQGAMVGTVGGAFWGAIGGWITDALIRKRETVYVVPPARSEAEPR